jgi:hypothetical protein
MHRIRRGKLVEIPDEWVGQTTHKQTIRKRQSKHLRKIRMLRDTLSKCHPRNHAPRHRGGRYSEIDRLIAEWS